MCLFFFNIVASEALAERYGVGSDKDLFNASTVYRKIYEILYCKLNDGMSGGCV